jgi:hypothetical protein
MAGTSPPHPQGFLPVGHAREVEIGGRAVPRSFFNFGKPGRGFLQWPHRDLNLPPGQRYARYVREADVPEILKAHDRWMRAKLAKKKAGAPAAGPGPKPGAKPGPAPRAAIPEPKPGRPFRPKPAERDAPAEPAETADNFMIGGRDIRTMDLQELTGLKVSLLARANKAAKTIQGLLDVDPRSGGSRRVKDLTRAHDSAIKDLERLGASGLLKEQPPHGRIRSTWHFDG